MTLDENRNSIQPAYVVQIVKDGGELGFKVVETVPEVDQTFGGLLARTRRSPAGRPAKVEGNPPPWAQ